MKKLLLIGLIIIIANSLYAQQKFTLVKEIDLDNINLSKINKITAEFKSNRKLVSKYKAIKLSEIVKLCDNCFAEVEDSNGNTKYLSPNDLNQDINQQQILLLVESKFSGLGDTLVIGEDDLGKLKDNELLDVELGSVSNIAYNLNSKDWNKANRSKYFKSNSIIFPFDNSTIRWITDVKKIRIYKR